MDFQKLGEIQTKLKELDRDELIVVKKAILEMLRKTD